MAAGILLVTCKAKRPDERTACWPHCVLLVTHSWGTTDAEIEPPSAANTEISAKGSLFKTRNVPASALFGTLRLLPGILACERLPLRFIRPQLCPAHCERNEFVTALLLNQIFTSDLATVVSP